MTTAARDIIQEVEGSLLPTAELVTDDDLNDEDSVDHGNNNSKKAAMARVVNVPTEYFSDSGGNCATATATATATTTTTTIPYAPVIRPYGGTNLHDSVLAERLVQEAQEKGRMLTEQEKGDIRRNARKINAIHWNQKNQVNEAMRRAKQIQGNEDAGFVQTTVTLEQPTPTPPVPSRKEPEFFPGTYGKEYEVTEYTFGSDYETKEYEVSEYKSVYE